MTLKIFNRLGLFFFLVLFLGCASAGDADIKAKKPLLGLKGNVSGSSIVYIDTHNHLHGRFASHSPFGDLDYEGAAGVALKAMNKMGIKKMFIMPPPFSPDHPNRYTFEDLLGPVKRYPDRFAFLGGGGTLNVMIHQAVRDGMTSPEVKNKFGKKAVEILSKGAIGFGEMAAEHLSLNHDHPHEYAPPDHPLFLLLADIAARHNVPIDIHMEAVPEDMPLPKNRRLRSGRNPDVLKANIPAFERLLRHNRKARIVWAHVGWCNTGQRTVPLIANLLKKHPNLYMSFKISPRDSFPENCPIERGCGLKAEWINLIRQFPERFVIGSDQFYLSPRMHGQIGPRSVEPTHRFLSLLPPDLAHKVGFENAERLFNLHVR